MAYERLAAILAFSLGVVTAPSQTPTPTGAIEGTVVDVDGQPVEGVRVSVADLSVPLLGALRLARTDRKGHFLINGLEWGLFHVYTEKESDGYADSFKAIHSLPVPIAEISEAAPLANVQVRIGPRAAVLSGSITDAITGEPVEHVSLRVWHWTDGIDRDYEYISAGVYPTYRFLIPPNKEVGVEFSAPGYDAWEYCGDWGGDKPFPLNLSSGANKTVNVKLRPLPK